MRLGLLVVVAGAELVASPARAEETEAKPPRLSVAVGIESFAYATDLPTFDSGPQVGLGLVVQERFALKRWDAILWQDVRLPMTLPLNYGSDAIIDEYVAIGLGLRYGYRLGPWIPYLGGLATVLVIGGINQNPVPGVGGDVGMDLALGHFLVGLECRAEAIFTQYLGAHALLDGLLSGSYRF
jgi:hypothetical protein